MRFILKLFFVLCVGSFSFAETRDGVRTNDLNKEYSYSTLDARGSGGYGVDHLRNKDGNLGLFWTRQYSVSKDKGELVNFSRDSNPDNGNNYRLNLKVTCLDSSLPIPVIARFKDVSWKLKLNSGKVLNSLVQTNEAGFLVVSFTTAQSLGGQRMFLEMNGHSTDISLENGPYEVFFPPKACKRLTN